MTTNAPVRITVSINQRTKQLLERIAEDEDLSVSQLVRRSIRRYLALTATTAEGKEGEPCNRS